MQPLFDAFKGRIGHYIFAGSTVIYADTKVLPIRETHPLDEGPNQGDYGKNKILAERWPKDGPQPVSVDAQPAPDISWVAWLGAAANPDTNPARPFYLKAPDAKPAAQPPLAAEAATS